MANEKRLINVNKVINAMQKCLDEAPDKKWSVAYYAFESIIECLKQEPTVDAAPVVHGRWVRLDAHKGMEQFKCSICRSECYVPTCMNDPMYEYCPNCGAKMDGGSDHVE